MAIEKIEALSWDDFLDLKEMQRPLFGEEVTAKEAARIGY